MGLRAKKGADKEVNAGWAECLRSWGQNAKEAKENKHGLVRLSEGNET